MLMNIKYYEWTGFTVRIMPISYSEPNYGQKYYLRIRLL